MKKPFLSRRGSQREDSRPSPTEPTPLESPTTQREIQRENLRRVLSRPISVIDEHGNIFPDGR
jgi:hypothetical protein